MLGCYFLYAIITYPLKSEMNLNKSVDALMACMSERSVG